MHRLLVLGAAHPFPTVAYELHLSRDCQTESCKQRFECKLEALSSELILQQQCPLRALRFGGSAVWCNVSHWTAALFCRDLTPKFGATIESELETQRATVVTPN